MEHLETIDWSHSRLELWHFVHELPHGVSPTIDGFRSSMVAWLLETLTDCHRESLLEVKLRYVTHADALDDAESFAGARDTIREPDLLIAEVAASGSSDAMGLPECVSTFAAASLR
jgi:hypothetical protein